jgi:tetratricopeptide (TPR) repeat protein
MDSINQTTVNKHRRNLADKIQWFLTAGTWLESKKIIDHYPELLGEEAIVLLNRLKADASEKGDEVSLFLFEESLALLQRCRQDGVDSAYSKLIRPLVPTEDLSIETPIGLDAELEYLHLLNNLVKQDPSLEPQRAEMIESTLNALPANEYLAYRGILLGELGNAYYNMNSGNKTLNLERSIACYNEALIIFTPQTSPYYYAAFQHCLGMAYDGLLADDQMSGKMRAIACYREALRFRSPEIGYIDYAWTHHNLGHTYWFLSLNIDQAGAQDNRKRAIDHFEEALRYRPVEDDPLRHAQNQRILGDVYKDLQIGEQAENLKRSKEHFFKALNIYTVQDTPYEYAATQSSLGMTYGNSPAESWLADLPKAINCFKEALAVYTPEDTPLEYARVQNNLGVAYLKLKDVNEAVNVQQAIVCHSEALQFYRQKEHPAEYATTKHNLGCAYLQLRAGNMAENLKKAIAYFQETLGIRNKKEMPLEYALTNFSMGEAYDKLVSGDLVSNLHKAIECYNEALSVFTREKVPFRYAQLQNVLGNAYRKLSKAAADRHRTQVDSFDKAQVCFEKALRILTPEKSPFEYAITISNLGMLHFDLPKGDRVANLLKSIDCYQEALQYIGPDRHTFNYAAIMLSMGMAQAALPVGERKTNLIAAQRCYQKALQIYTLESATSEYAATQINMGNVYFDLHTGRREDNLQQAIDCYHKALRFYTSETAPLRYASLQNNLGNAYIELPIGDRVENLEKAVVYFNEALRFRTPEKVPVEYGETMHNLGNALYYLSVNSDPSKAQENRLKVIEHFEKAIQYRPADLVPSGCRLTARSLGYVHFEQGRWDEAHTAYQTAIKAGELLYHVSTTEVARQAELSLTVDVYPNNGYCLARMGRLSEALECLEAGRTRSMAEVLNRDRVALQKTRAEDRTRFEDIRSRIKALEVEARSDAFAGLKPSKAGVFTELSIELRKAREELSLVVDRIRSYVPDFMAAGLDAHAITTAVIPGRPLIYLIATSQGGMALIITANGEAPETAQAIWIDGFSQEDLDEMLEERNEYGEVASGLLVGQVDGDMPTLKAALEKAMPVLSEKMLGPVIACLADSDYQEATVVAGGHLSLLPLHAAIPDLVAMVYTPSARALVASKHSLRNCTDREPILLGVGNPLPNPDPLPLARLEVEEITSLFEQQGFIHNSHCETEATRKKIMKALAGSTYLHFSCHGKFDANNPLESALYLAGGDRLTLRDLLDNELDLSGVRLVVLSACQTGITDFRKVPDEAVGLPAGFIQSRAAGVISTLWPVNDLSTAALMKQLYRYHLIEDLEPSLALRKAQLWLRDATASDMKLSETYKRILHDSRGQDAEAMKRMHYYRAMPDVQPFKHPYYWAGFVFTGT